MSVPAARPVFCERDRAEIASMIDTALRTGALTLGPVTERFEAAVAETVGTRFAVAVASGTAALEITLRTAGVADRDVVVPTNTFFASAAAVVHAGGRPQFADIDPATMALSRATIEEALTSRTAAVVLVHIGGVVSPDVADIRALCDERGLTLIEDAAHAHGATVDGRHAGTFGHAATLSFYPTKVVTSGEGGMILTDDERYRSEAVVYRDQGKAGFLGGEHVRMGAAWRMSELHAAVGVTQWARLDEFVGARRAAAAVYDEQLGRDQDVVRPHPVPDRSRSNYYKYIAMLRAGIDRDQLKTRLRSEYGVSMSGEVYNLPLHRQPVFAGLSDRDFPAADEFCARHVCLPVHSDMTEAEAGYVAASIADAVRQST
jgi:dTDP-4-amino-4,6-dideoxygalactose transaminase